MVESVLGETRYVVLSGPSHAEEVSRRVPTAVVAASADLALAELVQQSFINDNFRVYTGTDVVGVELGGALKNVMAIAAGIIDGMKLGDNPKAALMTRGISEMGRLGELLGGKAQTFSGLSGIGDLIVTCTSGHSRNRHVGEELGRGKKLPEILASMGMVVAEGVTTAKGAHALARPGRGRNSDHRRDLRSPPRRAQRPGCDPQPDEPQRQTGVSNAENPAVPADFPDICGSLSGSGAT